MQAKTALMLVGLAALVGAGVYLGRKGTSAAAGAVSSLDSTLTGAVFSIPGATLFQDSAGNFDPVNAGYEAGQAARAAVVNAGGAVLNAMPSAQVPAVVDMAGPTPDIGTILYESALMGGGG